MPDDPQGLSDQQNPSPAPSGDQFEMPPEVSAFVAEMASGLGDLAGVPEGGSGEDARGTDDGTASDDGRPASFEARGADDDDDARDDPTTDSDDGSTQADASAARTDDDADLSQYPERVQAAWKKLSRSERAAILDDADRRAEERTRSTREEAERLAREKADADARIAEIRARNARFIGAEPVQRDDGTKLPSYDELQKLLTSRNGDDVLDETYGLSRHEAMELKETWDERREMLDGNAEWFDTQAWGKLSWFMQQGLQRAGVDPAAMLQGIERPDQVIDRLVTALKSGHDREIAALKKDYEGRIASLSLNGEALKGRAVAGSRAPDTGGRSGASGRMSPQRVREALNNPAEFEKNRDAIYAAIGL